MNTSMDEESYMTAPMMTVVRPTSTTEEDIHDMFEAAISTRLLTMREQMNRISGPLTPSRKRFYETEALPTFKTQLANMYAFSSRWQRVVLFGCLSLILAMIGFDVMGLLILAMR
jgi:hypothetical protein